MESLATFAYPSYLTSGNTSHEGIVFHILGDNSPSSNQCAAAYGMTAYHRAVRSERCTFLYQCLGINSVDGKVGTRCGYIGEHTRWTAKHIVLNLHALID